MLGPVPGVVIGVVTCAVHALLMGDFWGGLMNAAAVTVFVLVSSGIYWRERDTAVGGLQVGAGWVVGHASDLGFCKGRYFEERRDAELSHTTCFSWRKTGFWAGGSGWREGNTSH
ncbi:hypothetical protein [Slackia heliotrinireducens]|uniref:hypothetical protein n=1 Tax=Slackia heliotrinireducens TaxID=84110 RepID=UPI00331529BA